MKKILTRLGIILAGLIGLLVVVVIAVWMVSSVRMNKTYTIPAISLTIPSDAATLTEGKRQFTTRGCADCHGTDGAGTVVLDDPWVGTVTGSNLTSGTGGRAGQYDEGDWERAIRHGVSPTGKPLIIMPAHEFYPINDSELATMIAYIKSLPAVDHTPAPVTLGLVGRLLLLTGMITVLPAEVIDHTAARPAPIAQGATQEYGAYLANGCAGCHGTGLSGGPIPGVPAEPPYPANLTPDVETGLGRWQEVDFIKAIRMGIRPDGTQLSSGMPWQAYSQMTDDEVRAIWLHLQSIPAKPYGSGFVCWGAYCWQRCCWRYQMNAAMPRAAIPLL